MANSNIPTEYLGLVYARYADAGNDPNGAYKVIDRGDGNGSVLEGPDPIPDLESYYVSYLSDQKEELSRKEVRKRLGALNHPLTGQPISTADATDSVRIERDLQLAQHDVTRALRLGVANTTIVDSLYAEVNNLLLANETIKATVRSDPVNTDVQALWDAV